MDNADLCLRARSVVADVGGYLIKYWGRLEGNDHSVKDHPTDHDVVTIHDVEAERRLQVGLSHIDPTVGFTGEEGGCQREADRYWLVDPIDGTDAFIRGLPFCTVQMALIEEGRPVIGIVYDFVRKEMVCAVKGQGTFCNCLPVRVSDRDLRTGKLILETDVRSDEKSLQLMLALRRRAGGLYQCFAAGWEFIQIACGRLEGRVTYKPWAQPLDLAPGVLLVQEAGGMATNIGQSGYDFLNTDVIACNAVVHRQLTSGTDAQFPLEQLMP